MFSHRSTLTKIAGASGLSRSGTPRDDRDVGREDALRPVGNGMRLARLIPGARYVEFPNAGHLVPLEAMDELLRVIEEGQPS